MIFIVFYHENRLVGNFHYSIRNQCAKKRNYKQFQINRRIHLFRTLSNNINGWPKSEYSCRCHNHKYWSRTYNTIFWIYLTLFISISIGRVIEHCFHRIKNCFPRLSLGNEKKERESLQLYCGQVFKGLRKYLYCK